MWKETGGTDRIVGRLAARAVLTASSGALLL
jgi:hypothetical protein